MNRQRMAQPRHTVILKVVGIHHQIISVGREDFIFIRRERNGRRNTNIGEEARLQEERLAVQQVVQASRHFIVERVQSGLFKCLHRRRQLLQDLTISSRIVQLG